MHSSESSESSGLLSSSHTTTTSSEESSTSQVNTLIGQRVSVIGQNVTSIGSVFGGKQGVHVEGRDKQLATSMATAGVVAELNQSLTIGGKTLNNVTLDDGFAMNLGKNLINNTANGVLNSAVNGTPLDQALESGLVNAVITTSTNMGAKGIGDMTVPDSTTGIAALNPAGQAVLHVLLGCAGAVAQKADCAKGAASGVIGELTSEWYNPNGEKDKTGTVHFAKIMAGVAVTLADGTPHDVNVGIQLAGNAAENNFLMHAQIKAFAEEMQSCKNKSKGCNDAEIQNIIEKYAAELQTAYWKT